MKDSYIMLTQDCNNDCLFCSVPKKKIYPSLEEIRNKIDSSVSSGYDQFTFTGGEPTLHSDLLKIISYVCSKGKHSRMITNGVELDNDKIDSLINSGLNYLIFSIHTINPEKAKKISDNENYDLYKILDVAKYAFSKKKLKTIFNITIMKLNYKELPEIIKYLTSNFHGLKQVTLNYVDLQGNVIEKNMIDEVALPYYLAEPYMYRAFKILKDNNVDFRVERVPLCYLVGYEKNSSDYNRVMDKEALKTYFMNEEQIRDDSNSYKKSKSCKFCRYNKFCLGISPRYFEMFGTKDIYPIFNRQIN